MDIREFLLARIAEDERLAQRMIDELGAQIEDYKLEGSDENGPFTPTRMLSAQLWTYYDGQTRWRNFARGQYLARIGDPARVLRGCAAKRAIVEAQHWEPEERPTDVELHARAAHPAYEYETTEGPRKQWDNPEEPPEGEGWEPNTAKGYRDGWARLEYTEESYWRRLKPEAERCEWEQYIPKELRVLASIYSDHPDYQEEWAL